MTQLHLKTSAVLSAARLALLFCAAMPAAFAGPVPSGEVTFAQGRVEPAYDGRDGSFAFLQFNAARAAGRVTEIPLPPATFRGSVVPAGIYEGGTPVPPAPPLP